LVYAYASEAYGAILGSSSLPMPTKSCIVRLRAISSVGRAIRLHRKGRGFESLIAHMERLEAKVHGRVQGVWFRDSTRRMAEELGLTGEVRNLPDGTVHVVAEGMRDALDRLLAFLHIGPPAATVEKVEAEWNCGEGSHASFDIA
jgi:acylphosphatase